MNSAPRVFVTALHGTTVALGVAYLLGGFGPVEADPWRIGLLIAAAVMYFGRLLATQYLLLARTFPWAEAAAVGPWIVICQATMAGVGGRNPAPVDWVTWAGVGVYLLGSWLNTGSELARKRFKADPTNKGRLFTGHGFALVRHPNYLGDSLLFTGFAMITGSWWAGLIPLLMTAMFVWMHIPQNEAHMAEHYGDQWADYAQRTQRFIPGIW